MSIAPHVHDVPLDGFAFIRASQDRRHETLSLLLTGQANGSAAAVANFVDFAREQKLPLDQLWAACRGGPHGPIAAAALFIPGAGRAVMLFISPARPGDSPAPAAGLLRAACRSFDPHQISLVQGMLETTQQVESATYRRAGFQQVATLVYMQRTGGARDLPATLGIDFGPGLELAHYDPTRRSLFTDALLASYEGTLDCPQMCGLRQIDDVLDGYMAIGQFVPSLWLTLVESGRPAGVMMLNPVLDGQAMELVYLGLSKPWRGRGLARRLLEYGIALTRLNGISQMLLAVDERNTPAIKLYRTFGFEATQRKTAWVFSTNQGSSTVGPAVPAAE